MQSARPERRKDCWIKRVQNPRNDKSAPHRADYFIGIAYEQRPEYVRRDKIAARPRRKRLWPFAHRIAVLVSPRAAERMARRRIIPLHAIAAAGTRRRTTHLS